MTADWPSRFEVFAARKEAEAARVHLPPYRTVRVQSTAHLEPVGNAWTRQIFDGDFYMSRPGARIPATNLVIVQSKDGNTGAADPSTLGGGATDTHLVYEGLSRVAADAVLAGSATVGDADLLFSVWKPELVALRETMGLPRHPMQIVATKRGLPFARSLLLNVPTVPVIILTVGSAMAGMDRDLAARPWITVIDMKEPEDLPSAFERLRTMGVRRVSCVGGRTMARALMDAGLVQDLYLTTSARAGGEADTPLRTEPVRGTLVLRKEGTEAEAGVTFEHLLLEPSA